MPQDDPRAALVELAAAAGQGLTALSAMLGRNPAYLGQYVRRGSPRVLPERERRLLADHFGVGETVLGAEPRGDAAVRLPRLDVAASAGPGSTVDEEVETGAAWLPAPLARRLGLGPGPAGASVIRVRGSSMEPGLVDGDHIVVDRDRRTPPRAGGLYVVRIDDALLVKRVARRGGRLVVTSDNPAAPPVPDGPIKVIGLVVWQMRAPR